MRCFVLLTGMTCFLLVSATATTCVVDPYGTGDFPTIQAVIDAAVDGDINLLYLFSGAKTNHWLNIRCAGTVSNASGIGVKIKVKATINGTPLWQTRELFGQTGFGGQNSLNAEFGLGDAQLYPVVSQHVHHRDYRHRRHGDLLDLCSLRVLAL